MCVVRKYLLSGYLRRRGPELQLQQNVPTAIRPLSAGVSADHVWVLNGLKHYLQLAVTAFLDGATHG